MSAENTGVVLIHGGNSSGAAWSRMAPLLSGPVLSVDLPGRNDPSAHAGATFAAWAGAVCADMDVAGLERGVFVGHSMGGGTLAALARLHPDRTAGVIYFAAVAPPDGGLFLEGLSISQQDHMHRSRALGLTTLPRPPSSDEDGADSDLRFIRETGSSEALAPFFEPVSLAGLANAPLGYVKLLRDRQIELPRQDAIIARLDAVRPCAVREVDAGHMAMVRDPEASARAVEDLRRAFGV
jgi:pimeloyl-ACP methyl ester carboxylesterase